ncbi:MAG: hypothetical protein ACYCX4_02760 [Bacillota bacterium]
MVGAGAELNLVPNGQTWLKGAYAEDLLLQARDIYGAVSAQLLLSGSSTLATLTGNLTVTGTITGNLSGNATTATSATTAASATNADTVDGHHITQDLGSGDDVHFARVYASAGAFKLDDNNYITINSGVSMTLHLGGGLKQTWSSLAKVRLDPDGDGLLNDRSFGVNYPGAMQPLLMDMIHARKGRVDLDPNFLAFVGGYSVFLSGGTLVNQQATWFEVDGSGDITCLVVGVQKGKEGVAGYSLVEGEEIDPETKEKKILPRKAFSERRRSA